MYTYDDDGWECVKRNRKRVVTLVDVDEMMMPPTKETLQEVVTCQSLILLHF